MKKFWTIKNQTTNSADILLYGPISESTWWGDEVTPKQFAEDLASLGNVSEINIRINSGGGDVFAGQAIHSMLKRHAAKINVYIDGLAASIASVIAMAGDRIIMPTGSMMMIHNPAVLMIGYYQAEEMRDYAEYLDKVRDTIAAVYEQRTGKSQDEIAALLSAETWMTASEAVEMGFADEVEEFQVAASVNNGRLCMNGIDFDLSKFKNAPKILNFIPDTKPKNNESEGKGMEISVQMLKEKHPSIYDSIVQEGIQAERNRMKAIDELDLPGNKEILDNAKYVTGASAEAVAMEIVKAEKLRRGNTLKNMEEDAAPLSDIPSAPAPEDPAKEDEKKAEDIASMMAKAANQKRGNR